MTAVYEGRRTWLTPVVGRVERAIYRVAGVDERSEFDWRRYALAALLVNLIGFARRVLAAAPARRAASESRKGSQP